MISRSLHLSRAAMTASLMHTAPLAAAASVSTSITFNEPAFPISQTTLSGAQSYNVLNDVTGEEIATPAELLGLTGDLPDLTVSVQSTAGLLGNTSWQWQPTSTGRFTASHAYSGGVGANNPGSLNANTILITFGDHLTVTNFSFHGLSFNTAGVSWEYTVVEFLQADGNSFSAPPVIGSYLDHTPINGSPSTGWFVMDSKGTVSGVGSGQTSSGSNGALDNIAGLGLGYAEVGIPAGTEIGGIRITTFLEDVRGTGNGTTSFTSSLTDITITGTVVPEPSVLLAGSLGPFGLLRRRMR